MHLQSRSRNSVGAVVLAAGLSFLMACAPSSGGPASTAKPSEPAKPADSAKPAEVAKPAEAAKAETKPATEIPIKVGLIGVGSANYAYVYGALDRGFFAKNGLKPDITDHNSGSAAQEALAAGEADFIHYFPPGIATAVSKGVKEKIIATEQFRPSQWHVAVAAGSPIQKIEDLNGKKIGVTAKGSTTDFFAGWLDRQEHQAGDRANWQCGAVSVYRRRPDRLRRRHAAAGISGYGQRRGSVGVPLWRRDAS